jgi:cell division protein FtsW (lipid II flippase)
MIDGKLLAFTILLLLAGVFHIATTSIGIQCSNANPSYKEEHPSNSSFLISQLVCAILITILAIVGIYLAVTDKGVEIKANIRTD